MKHSWGTQEVAGQENRAGRSLGKIVKHLRVQNFSQRELWLCDLIIESFTDKEACFVLQSECL